MNRMRAEAGEAQKVQESTDISRSVSAYQGSQSDNLFEASNIQVIEGWAKLSSPNEVKIELKNGSSRIIEVYCRTNRRRLEQ